MSSEIWDQLDPQVAAALREIFDTELDNATLPLRQAQADLEFRQEEQAFRARHPDYQGTRRLKILEFAQAHGISDLSDAYNAWRGQNAGTTAAEHDLRLQQAEEALRRAHPEYSDHRLEVLTFAVNNGIPNLDHAFSAWQSSQGSRSQDADGKVLDPNWAEWDRMNRKTDQLSKLNDDRDAQAEKMLRAANDPDRIRNETAAEFNQAREGRLKEEATRAAFGHKQDVHSPSKEERRAIADLRAIELFRGHAPAEVVTPSPADREADLFGRDAADQRFVEAIHSANEDQ